MGQRMFLIVQNSGTPSLRCPDFAEKLVKDKLPRIIVGEKFSITMYTKLPLFIVGSPNMVDREVQSFYFVFYDNLEKVRAPI